jgi:phage-related minor tail protein
VQFTGSAQAAAAAARQIKARGEELDRMREEHLRLLAKLQMLDGGHGL